MRHILRLFILLGLFGTTLVPAQTWKTSTHRQGTVMLHLKGEVKSGFQYYFRRGNVTFLEGQVLEKDVDHIEPIQLPFGTYTFQSIAMGYGTDDPTTFTLSKDNDLIDLSITLTRQKVQLYLGTTPEDITNDSAEVILRQLDPQNGHQMARYVVKLGDEPITLEEGNYTAEFPFVEGYKKPGGKAGSIGPFALSAKSPIEEITGVYEEALGDLSIALYTKEGFGEELQHLSFTLINSKGERRQYPRKNSFTFDSVKNKVQLTIKGLQEGSYTVEFQTPKNLFKPIDPQNVFVTADDCVGIDQFVSPQWGSLEVVVQPPEKTRFTKVPQITIQDEAGKIVGQSSRGRYFSASLKPGSYTVYFEDLAEYNSPREIIYEVIGNQTCKPILGQYEKAFGSASILFDTGQKAERLDQIQFTLTNSNNEKFSCPSTECQVSMINNGREVTFEKLPVGQWRLEFNLPNEDGLFETIEPKILTISKNNSSKFHQSIRPRYGEVNISVDLPSSWESDVPTPWVALVDSEGETVRKSTIGQLIAGDLIPGKYTVQFEQIEGMVCPNTVAIAVNPNQRLDPIKGSYRPALGSATIIYTTGPRGERLDRVRFWLTSEKGDRQMFPKAQDLTQENDTKNPAVTVKVADLPIGRYSLEFLVPNADNLFAPIPKKEFVVERDQCTAVVQNINPRYSSIEATVKEDASGHSFKKAPSITLQKIGQGQVASSQEGRLIADNLLPGEYLLNFGETIGFETPPAIPIKLAAGQKLEPMVGRYTFNGGSLSVTYSTGPQAFKVDEIFFYLKDPEGKVTAYPNKQCPPKIDASTGQRHIELHDLFPGRYQISWEVPGKETLFKAPQSRPLNVASGCVTEVDETITPFTGSLEVICQMPEKLKDVSPQITVTDAQDKGVETSFGHLNAENLLPGDYLVSFGSATNADAPEPIKVRVEPQKKAGPFVVEYVLGEGNVVITFDTSPEKTFTNKVQVTLFDPDTGKVVTLKQNRMKEGGITISHVPCGHYLAQLNVPGDQGLFASDTQIDLAVDQDQTTKIHQSLRPRYGGVQVTIDSPVGFEKTPEISLKEAQKGGRVVETSRNGQLASMTLCPGEYQLLFEKIDDFACPEPILVQISPNGIAGPFNALYEPLIGQLTVTYSTGDEKQLLDSIGFTLIDSKGDRTLYPQKNEYVESPEAAARVVTIDDLRVGTYTVEFFSSAPDGLFEPMKPHNITIQGGGQERVNEQLTPHFAQICAEASFDDDNANQVTISLKDELGRLVEKSSESHLLATHLFPGNYTIQFSEIDGYDTPNDVKIKVQGSEVAKPIVGSYQRHKGTLSINCSTGREQPFLEEISCSLIDANGKEMEYTINSKGSIVVENLPTGPYTIAFDVPEKNGLFESAAPKQVTISKDRNVRVSQEFSPRWASVYSTVDLPKKAPKVKTALMTLLDDAGNVVASSKNNPLSFDRLVPGDYRLIFADIENYDTPETIKFTANPAKSSGPFVGKYQRSTGKVVLDYELEHFKEYSQDIHFTFTGSDKQRHSYGGNKEGHLVIDDLPVGQYTLEASLSKGSEFFEGMDRRVVSITKEKAVEISHLFTAYRGGLIVETELADGRNFSTEEKPVIQILSNEEIVKSSTEGRLTTEDLLPGQYFIHFSEIQDYETPKDFSVTITPENLTGPLKGHYQRSQGRLTLSYELECFQDYTPYLRFTFTGTDGKQYSFKGNNNGKLIIDDLPVDKYSLQASFTKGEELFVAMPEQEVWVTKGREAEVSLLFEAGRGGVSVTTTSQDLHRFSDEMKPSITIFSGDKVVASSKEGQLMVDNLRPAQYWVQFGDVKDFETPDTVSFTVSPKQIFGPIEATYTPSTGDIIISYSTGPKRERMERIRLWITDPDGKRSMYPVEDQFTDNGDVREIRLDHLKVGVYSLEFIIPNTDSLFEDATNQTFIVRRNETTQISKTMLPQYSSICAKVGIPQDAVGDQTLITLKDEQGHQITTTSKNHLTAEGLLPGNYTLSFHEVEGYVTPKPVTLKVKAGQIVEAESVDYRLATGKLEMEYWVEGANDLTRWANITLTDDKGNSQTFTRQARSGGKCCLVVEKMPIGSYQIDVSFGENDAIVEKQNIEAVQITLDETAKIALPFHLKKGTLVARVDAPKDALFGKTPLMILKDEEDKIVASTTKTSLEANQLPPGSYQLSFADIPNYHTPKSLNLILKPNETTEALTCYERTLGSVEITYRTDEEKTRLDRVRFYLVSQEGERTMYPIGDEYVDSSDGTRRVRIGDLPTGTYNLEFLLPNHDGLFVEVPQRTIQVKPDEIQTLNEEIKPRFASLSVVATGAEGITDPIVLQDEAGQTVLTGKRKIETSRLLPGHYTLLFPQDERYIAPRAQKISIKADESQGPICAEYLSNLGRLTVTFNTDSKKTRLSDIEACITGNTLKKPIVLRGAEMEEDSVNDGVFASIDKLIAGQYQIAFSLPNEDDLFAPSSTKTFQITPEKTTSIVEHFIPRFASLQANAQLPEVSWLKAKALITLVDAQGQTIISAANTLSHQTLLPGRYTVRFSDIDELVTPREIDFEVTAGEKLGSLVGQYQLGEGSVDIRFGSDEKAAFMNAVTIIVANPEGEKELYSRDKFYTTDDSQLGLRLEKAQVGQWQCHFQLPQTDGFLPTEATKTFLVSKDKTSHVSENFKPAYGSLKVVSHWPTNYPSKEALPPIIVENEEGQIIQRSETGDLELHELIPGRYRIAFGVDDLYDAPEPVWVTVNANSRLGPIIGEYSRSMGEATICYSTDETGVRLDRVRFWLIDENDRLQMYPKGSQYVDDMEAPNRTVTVKGLPTGKYSLRFLLPNADGLFDDIPDRPFYVHSEQTTTINQEILPRYSSLKAVAKLPFSRESQKPLIRIRNASGDLIKTTEKSDLFVDKLLPGEYFVEFLDDPDMIAPQGISVSVAPNTAVGPITGNYRLGEGTMAVSYDTGRRGERLDSVRFTITDERGTRRTFPSKDSPSQPHQGGRRVIIKDLPVGDYTVEFFVPNDDNFFSDAPNCTVSVDKNATEQLSHSFVARWSSLKAMALLPENTPTGYSPPQLWIEDDAGNIIAEGRGELQSSEMLPGHYTVIFGEHGACLTPEPISINVQAGSSVDDLLGKYHLATGSITVSYNTGETAVNLEDVRCTVSDKRGHSMTFPQEKIAKLKAGSKRCEFVLNDMPVGDYEVTFEVPRAHNLFGTIPSSQITVRKNEQTTFHKELKPRFAQIALAAQVPTHPTLGQKKPEITVYNPYDEVVAKSDEGNLVLDQLVPGEYEICYSTIEGYRAPKRQTIRIEPNQKVDPIVGQYSIAEGSLELIYYTDTKAQHLRNIAFTLTDQNGNVAFSSRNAQMAPDSDTSGLLARLDNIPTGKYTLNFSIPDTGALLPNIPPQELVIAENQTLHLTQPIEPRYGSIEASVIVPPSKHAIDRMPAITLTDKSGRAIQSSFGTLVADRMAPGEYQVSFEAFDHLVTPDPVQITLKPNESVDGIIGKYAIARGSLKVTYNTGMATDRVDGVIFTIQDEWGQSSSFPKTQNAIVKPDEMWRQVTVEELPVGQYTLQFKVPNPDALFNEPKVRSFVVHEGETVSIEESIEPRYGLLKAEVQLPDSYRHEASPKPWRLAKSHQQPLNSGKLPQISLIDSKGNTVAVASGTLEENRLLPGKYELYFEEVGHLSSPQPVAIYIEPEQKAGPIIGEYQVATGLVTVKYSTGPVEERIDQVKVTFTDEGGNQLSLPVTTPTDEKDGTRSITTSLPTGTYRVNFFIPNDDELFERVSARKIAVAKDEQVTIQQHFKPRYATVEACAAFIPEERQGADVALLILQNSSGEAVVESSSGLLHAEKLLPGRYRLSFGKTPHFDTPRPVEVNLEPGMTAGPFVGNYLLSHGAVTVEYDAGQAPERLSRVRFWLVDNSGARTMYPKGGDFVDNQETGSRKVVINEVPVGTYTLEWILPNQDNLFDPIAPESLTVEKGSETSITHSLKPRHGVIEVSYSFDNPPGDDIQPIIRLTDSFGETKGQSDDNHLLANKLPPGNYTAIFDDVPGYITPEPIEIILLPDGYEGPISALYVTDAVEFSVKVNWEEQGWTLYRSGEVVAKGAGTKGSLKVPPGEGYYLVPDNALGYGAAVYPQGTFTIEAGKPQVAEIRYKQAFGTVEMKGPMADGEIINVIMTPEGGGEALRQALQAKNHAVHWNSDAMPTGRYLVTYDLPNYFGPVRPQEINIEAGKKVVLEPDFLSQRKLSVATNIADATFVLTSAATGEAFEGKGNQFTFENLLPGEYQLTFLDAPQHYFITPTAQTITVNKDNDVTASADYLKASSLIVSSNVDQYAVTISALDGQGKPYGDPRRETITSRSKTFHLPEGQYRIAFETLQGEWLARYGKNKPSSVNVSLHAARPERIHGLYEANKGSLVVTSNIEAATFTVRDISDEEGLVIGRFHGEYTIVPMTYAGRYEVTFEEIPAYATPQSIIVNIGSNERKIIGGNYVPEQKVAPIPKGPAIIGDTFGEGADDERPARTVDISAFSIALYPVTNAQYAAWLTKAHKESKVIFITEASLRGQIKDSQGHVLCETIEADPNSQITAKVRGDTVAFVPLSGKENHPVIEVSWYGADLYCKDNGLRLPSEAEWEKAAGQSFGSEPQKFRYGCAKDTIDRTYVNYVDSYSKKKSKFEVRSTPVGFYNGVNLLALSADQGRQIAANPDLVKTHYGTNVAKSPSGCYDMSGNVREWTGDWYDPESLKKMGDIDPQGPGYGTKKVTKGGCYDSFAYEVRVSARLPLAPESTDAYTGFRIVLEGTR